MVSLPRQLSGSHPFCALPERERKRQREIIAFVAKYMSRRPASPSERWLTSFATARRKLPPWTCSWFRASLSSCSTSSSSSSWPAEMLLAGLNKDRLHAARDEVGTSAADTLVLDVTGRPSGARRDGRARSHRCRRRRQRTGPACGTGDGEGTRSLRE